MWRLSIQRFISRLFAYFFKRSLHPWLTAAWKSAPNNGNAHWHETRFLVVDLETSSLSPKAGEILSIGWVAIHGGKIQLNSAQHLLLKNKESVGQSAVIHQIRDCQLEHGLTLEQACSALLQAATGHVLVFHHRHMDLQFLNLHSQILFGAKLSLPVVDTLQLEKRYLDHIGQPIQTGDLQLANTRNRYRLPPYLAHNALTDAIATAELLLAQIAHRGGHCQLKSLLS